MITQVFLKNWRSHLDSQFDFSEGTNCLIGSIGSGKTSVYDGVCFALFGTFPQLQQKKIRLIDVIMKKPQPQHKAEVSVKFEIDSDEYFVKRTIERGKSGAELRKNGVLLEAQPQRVTEEIEKILKIDYDLFTRAIYSEQNALDMFLTIPKGQRMKKIDELLRLDKFETARASCVSLVNRLEISKSEKEKLIEVLQQDESIKNIDKIREELEKTENERIALGKELEKIKKQMLEKKSEFEKLQDMGKKLQEISEETKAIVSVNKQIESDIQEIKKTLKDSDKSSDLMAADIKNISENIEKLSETIDTETENLDSLKQEFADNSARRKVLEQKLQEWESEIRERREIESRLLHKEKLSLLLQEKTKEQEGEKSFLRMMELKIFNLGKDIKEIKSAEKCPLCYQSLTEEKKNKLVARKQKEINTLGKQKEKHEKFVGILKEKLDRMEKEAAELQIAEIRLKGLKTEEDAKKIKNELEELMRRTDLQGKEVRMLEKNVSLLRQMHDKKINERNELKEILRKREEFEKKQKIMESNKLKIEELQEEKTLLEKQFSKEKLAEASEILYNLIGTESRTGQKMENIDLIIKEKQARLKDVENKMGMIKNYQRELRKNSALMEQLELLEKGLLLTQEQLRKNFVIAINQVMHSVWQELYPYGDFFSVKLGIDGDYILQLQDSTGWVSAEAVSGGERSLACLALRIAFALVLAPQLRWLVLDEPTANLDRRAISVLATTLRERIDSIVDQTFLITHDEELEAGATGMIYRLHRDKEKDGITTVASVS